MVGMVRGKGHRKRLYEKIEQWIDNEISFPSIPRCNCVGWSKLPHNLVSHSSRASKSEGYMSMDEVRRRVPLVGSSGDVNYPLGIIDLSVTMGELDRVRAVTMEFAVVKWHSPYNVILGRTGMRSLAVVASTIHSMIKFLTANEIETMVTDRN
ncbi:hypothetical protein Tco_1007189 [Tanacetum coccineum]